MNNRTIPRLFRKELFFYAAEFGQQVFTAWTFAVPLQGLLQKELDRYLFQATDGG